MPDTIPLMRHIFYVKDHEAEKARQIEKKILGINIMSGILFVGVSVEPEQPGKPPVYCVWIGCRRDVDEQTAMDLVKLKLGDELDEGMSFRIQAHCGIGRSIP
jgi:hypothetical protein